MNNNGLKRATSDKEMASGTDLRAWDRVPMCVPLFIRGVDERGKSFLDLATAVNVSIGGALVAVRRHAAVEAKITLELPASPIAEFEELTGAARQMAGAIVRIDTGSRFHLWAVRFDQPLN
jgi:PilZ domain-containing protein